MKYIVNVSGGLTSYEALRRTIERHGKESVAAYFADVRGLNPTSEEHSGEDEDVYRFIADQERLFGITIHRVIEHRDIWQVMFDERFMTLMIPGKGIIAPCSKILKREAIEREVARNHADERITHVYGMDWSEPHRMQRLVEEHAPMPVWFPLAERPYVDKCHIAAQLEAIGIAPPRMYKAGFEHANCGGFCVKAGQAHFANLLRWYPERYRYHEEMEQKFRQHVGKDVAILKDRRGGGKRPMTLREFRERIEAGGEYDQTEWGGCGCFASGAIQARMDELIMQADVEVS
jgi:hypothetical protein